MQIVTFRKCFQFCFHEGKKGQQITSKLTSAKAINFIVQHFIFSCDWSCMSHREFIIMQVGDELSLGFL